MVTGAAQGIGREIALRLAADGFDIALNDISAKATELQGVQDEIVRLGRKAGVFPADVTVEDEVRTMIEAVVADFGGVDVVRTLRPYIGRSPTVDTLDGGECRDLQRG